MGEQLQNGFRALWHHWVDLDKKKKIIYISIFAAIVMIAVIITIILNRKDYVVLYTGLETSEAAEIAAQIQELGYDAGLKTGGTVTVIKGTENQLAMEMSMQGYPKGSGNLDYSIYTDKVGMFTTESQSKTYDRLALQSRLSAIITSVNGINSATVTLAIPEQKNTVITTMKQDPSASVIVELERNNTLSNEQIQGISYLIARGVPGLKEENVSIVDGNGIPQIAGENSIDKIADLTRKLSFKTQLEDNIANKVYGLLAPGYGDDNVYIAVNIDLNFDGKISETTNYSPEDDNNTGVLQHGDASDASGTSTADGGVVGVETNADDTYPTGSTASGGAWTESSASNTYLVDTYKEQIEKEGYSVDGLSIGVVLYTDYISETSRAELIKLVANSGGVVSTAANDVVSIVNIPKLGSTEEVQAATPVFLFGLSLNQLLIAAAGLGILLIALFVALAITNRAAKKKRERFEKHLIEHSEFTELDKASVADGFNINTDGSVVEFPSLTDDTVETKEVAIRREIAEFAKTSPDIVAQLLKSWMKEEE